MLGPELEHRLVARLGAVQVVLGQGQVTQLEQERRVGRMLALPKAYKGVRLGAAPGQAQDLVQALRRLRRVGQGQGLAQRQQRGVPALAGNFDLSLLHQACGIARLQLVQLLGNGQGLRRLVLTQGQADRQLARRQG